MGSGKIMGRKTPKVNVRHVDVFLCIYIVTLLAFKSGGVETAICTAAFALFVLSGLVTICVGRQEIKAAIVDRYICCLVLFWVFSWASSLWALFPTFVFDSAILKRAAQIILSTFLLVGISKVRQNYGRTLLLVFTVGALIAVLILLIRVPISEWGEERLGTEAMGINANSLGVLLSLACCSCLYFLEKDRQGLWAILGILFYIVVIFTGTRQAMLTPLLYIAVRLLLDAKNVRTYFYIALFFAAVTTLYQFLITDPSMRVIVGDRLEQLVASVTGIGSYTEHSIIERSEFRSWAMELFFRSPIVGIGFNGFAGWLAASGYPHITTSHCNYTEILSGLGAIGFVLFYIPYFIVLRRAFSARKHFADARAIVAVIAVMLVTQDAGEVFSNIAYSIYFAGIYISSAGSSNGGVSIESRVSSGGRR